MMTASLVKADPATTFESAIAPSGDRPYFAYCFADDGAIHFGIKVPTAATEIVRGDQDAVKKVIRDKAGRGAEPGSFMVPNMASAKSQEAREDALAIWLGWCARSSPPGLAWTVARTQERRS